MKEDSPEVPPGQQAQSREGPSDTGPVKQVSQEGMLASKSLVMKKCRSAPSPNTASDTDLLSWQKKLEIGGFV